MARADRLDLIKKTQAQRDGRLCVVYVTSTRGNLEITMADDALRLLYDHLEAGREAAKKGIDLFIHSNGGSGTVPWRIVNLIREYTKHLAVLVPHRAFSAATLLAMGADEIVMHQMGCLGPIDPSVANIFNPPHPYNPALQAPISVEDVTAYFELVKDEVGVTHEDELVQALIALTDKIHPLALGNVQRSHHQARMMARKLLKQHMPLETQEHEIDQIIDTLKSNLFYHGHPINREEAKKDLKLKKVVDAPAAFADIMWKLYLEYEKDMTLTEPFQPLHELEIAPGAPPPAAPLTTAQIVQQLGQLGQVGIGLGNVPPDQLVALAAAMIPLVTQGASQPHKAKLEKLRGAYVESTHHADIFLTDLTLYRAIINTPAGPQDAVKTEITWQRWEKEP